MCTDMFSRLGTVASRNRFIRQRIGVQGHANFLAEPHAGIKADLALKPELFRAKDFVRFQHEVSHLQQLRHVTFLP